jgi:hypothetical protein
VPADEIEGEYLFKYPSGQIEMLIVKNQPRTYQQFFYQARLRVNMKAKIDAYVVKGEIVSVLQGGIGLKAEGYIHYLNAEYHAHPLVATPQRIKNHLMASVMQKLEQQGIK